MDGATVNSKRDNDALGSQFKVIYASSIARRPAQWKANINW